MVRHGARVKITEERLEQVEAFFERRGGMTILIGRFIGLVRAIAPFIAGASRMPLRKFLPYDVLGAGLWATTFCVLGFVFWRSFDQLTAWVSRGLFAFGLFVAVVVGIVFLVRLQRSPELRAKTQAWIAEQLERPLLRPVAPYLRAGWHRIGRPLARLSQPPARFVWNRFTPGELGLEVTTLLALAAVGSFTFALFASELAERTLLFGDRAALDIADRLYSSAVADVLELVSALGSFAVVAIIVTATTLWAVARRRPIEAAVLPVVVPAHRARGRAVGRHGRPAAAARRARGDRGDVVSLGPRRLRGGLGRLRGRARPRGRHARRPASPPSRRRSSSRRRSGWPASTCARSYLSDVEGGWGLAVAIFAAAGRRRGGRRPAASEWSAGSMSNQDLDLHRHRLRRGDLADRLGGARARAGVDVVLARRGSGSSPRS